MTGLRLTRRGERLASLAVLALFGLATAAPSLERLVTGWLA